MAFEKTQEEIEEEKRLFAERYPETSPESDVLSLTPKETVALKTLAQSLSHCTYDDLIDKLGGETNQSSFDKVRLEVLISRLRTKLFNFKEQAFEIKTIHGTGYRLTTALVVRER